MRRVLAIVAVERADTVEATEFLRVLVALRACAVPVELVEFGPGTGVLSKDPLLTEDGERYLAALSSNAIVPLPVAAIRLVERIDAASDVLRLGAPSAGSRAPVAYWNQLRGRPDAVEAALGAGAFVRR